MSRLLDVMELFAEAQALATRPEWLGASALLIQRKGRSERTLSVAEYHRQWRAKNPERARAITAAYRERQLAADREAFLRRKREANRRHYQRNAEAMRERARQYAAAKRAARVGRPT